MAVAKTLTGLGKAGSTDDEQPHVATASSAFAASQPRALTTPTAASVPQAMTPPAEGEAMVQKAQ
tara:strand:+ start:329 stop:523 length:195 start_codon:yes stop_codon:yes gene_type:complete